MKLKRKAKTLKAKALASLRRALEAFNGNNNDGRVETVLLFMQHTSEMLIKALLIQKGQVVFERDCGGSIGIKRALDIAKGRGWINGPQVGSIRAVNELRDQAQHWMVEVSEETLYINARSLITTVDEILSEHFQDTLADNLPVRVLPLSTQPLPDFTMLVNREYQQIRDLLAPGRRARDEARGRIATMLAMEAHDSEEVELSKRGVDRIEEAIKIGTPVSEVFPRLTALSMQVEGEGTTVRIRITKSENAAPVRYLSGDDPTAAGAIREVDFRERYKWRPQEFAKKLNLTNPKAKAVRDHLNIDKDKDNMTVIELGAIRQYTYSDKALNIVREAIKKDPGLVERAWQEKRQQQRPQ